MKLALEAYPDDIEATVTIWERHAEALGDNGGLAWIRVAQLAHGSLGRHEYAAAALRRVPAELMQTEQVAILGAAIGEALGRWAMTVDHLEVQARNDVDAALTHGMKAAQICSDHLADDERAFEILIPFLSDDALGSDGITLVSKLADSTGRWCDVFDGLPEKPKDIELRYLKVRAARGRDAPYSVRQLHNGLFLELKPDDPASLEWLAFTDGVSPDTAIEAVRRLSELSEDQSTENLAHLTRHHVLAVQTHAVELEIDILDALSVNYPHDVAHHERLVAALWRDDSSA